VEDSQHTADDGESQGNQKVKGPQDERINENDLKGFPHGSINPLSESLQNQRKAASASPQTKHSAFYNKREKFASPPGKKGIRSNTKYYAKKSRKIFKIAEKNDLNFLNFF
jgi:hypothetical protein